MPRRFIRELSDALHRQYPKMWMVGEVFDVDAVHTSYFIGGHTGWDGIDTKLDSVFDFPLWSKSLQVFTNKAPVRALRDEVKYDALYPDPLRLTTFANNHGYRALHVARGRDARRRNAARCVYAQRAGHPATLLRRRDRDGRQGRSRQPSRFSRRLSGRRAQLL